MGMQINRRNLLVAGLAGVTMILPGCASLPGLNLTEAIRRLLTLSSQNAFALLLQPGSFYDSQTARIALPDRFGGGNGAGILSVVLQSKQFRDKLQRQLNRAAEKGAERAAPLVAEAVRNVGIDDAASIISGGPQAASSFLRGKMGPAIIDAMLPGVADGLRLFDDETIGRAVQAVTGYDVGALASDISQKAENAVWSAIGAEEQKIRANPQSTNDPLLIGVFGLGGRI